MRATIFLVALFGAIAVLAGAAGAHSSKTYRTKVNLLRGGPTGASGNVRCPTRSCPRTCLSKRRVTLFRTEGGKNQSFGSARTNSLGAFKITAPLVQGDYFAKADKKRISGDTCALGVSVRHHF